MPNLYEITYAATNIFGTYIIYKLLTIFFDDLRSNRKIEMLSYGGYYLISSALFFLVRVPTIMMVSNVILFFCLTLNYHSTLKKRFISSFLSYMILMCIEIMISVFTDQFNFSVVENSEFNSIIGMILIRIVSMLVVSVIANLKNVKKDIPIPNFYWLGTIFISVSSLCLLMILVENINFKQIEATVLAFIILSINFMVIIMYDNLYRAFTVKSEKLLLEQQNKAYEKQFDLIQQSLRITQIMRHDIKNHMITLKALHTSTETIDFNEYVSKIISSVENTKAYSNSENYVIDSIINFKLQEIVNMGIIPSVEIIVPIKINLSSYDMTAIIGNLIDNSINALIKCKSEKLFSIKIKYSKDNIIITIMNSFNGEVKEKNGKFETTKSDMVNHGLGLISIEETVVKNKGHMNIQHDDKFFKVTISLPV